MAGGSKGRKGGGGGGGDLRVLLGFQRFQDKAHSQTVSREVSKYFGKPTRDIKEMEPTANGLSVRFRGEREPRLISKSLLRKG